MIWWDALMETARQRGVRVLLTGIGGNQTVSWNGYGALCQMISRGRWREAFAEARAISRVNGGASALRTFAIWGVLPWLPTPFYVGIRKLRSPRTRPRYPWQACAPINPEFEAFHGVKARARAMGPDSRLRVQPDTLSARASYLQRQGGVYEGYFAGCQARFGLDIRDPTADTRVAEFCLSLPEDQYLRNGQWRWLVRRAMGGRVPEQILANRQRGLQAADWLPQMIRHRNQMFAELARLERSDLARRAIDLPRLRRLVDALPAVDAADGAAVLDYRGVLELGLTAGRFILWAQAEGPASRQS